LLSRLLTYHHGVLSMLKKTLSEKYQRNMDKNCEENIINIMTNEFPSGSGKKRYEQCIFLEREGEEYGISKAFLDMLEDQNFYEIVSELIKFGMSRYRKNYEKSYQDTDFVLYQKYTYEDAC